MASMAPTVIMAGVAAVLVVLSSATVMAAAAGLDLDFYSSTCPRVEAIVKEEMTEILKVSPTLAGPLLRLHFHDCFVRVHSCCCIIVALHCIARYFPTC
jgi:peroxidase